MYGRLALSHIWKHISNPTSLSIENLVLLQNSHQALEISKQTVGVLDPL